MADLIVNFPQHQSLEVLRPGNNTRKAKQQLTAEALRAKNQQRLQKAREQEEAIKRQTMTSTNSVALDLPRTPQADAMPGCRLCAYTGFRKIYTEHKARYFDGRRFYDITPCECQGPRVQELRWRKIKNLSQITDKMRNWTFETFVQKREPQAYAAALQFAQNPQGWLVFYGRNGSGKTHLMSAIAQRLITDNRIAVYCVAPDILDRMRNCFSDKERIVEERHTATQLLNLYREADVLLLDELGAEKGSDWAGEQFDKIFDYRNRAGLPTVVATNLFRADIEARGNFRLADRLFDAAENVAIEMQSKTSYRSIPRHLREKAQALAAGKEG